MSGPRRGESDEDRALARAEHIKRVVDAAPPLTDAQREQLRPLLAGTIPAEPGRAVMAPGSVPR
jgi:hypothetical protein